MKRLVEFPLEAGGSVKVEIEDIEAVPVPGMAFRGERVVEKAAETFEKTLAKIKPAVNAVVATLGDIALKPDEVGVEFGVTFDGKFDAVIAGASAGASLKVTLTWKPSK